MSFGNLSTNRNNFFMHYKASCDIMNSHVMSYLVRIGGD